MGRATRGGPGHGREHAADPGERGPASPARDHALLSSLRDIVLVRDADGVVTYCSPSVFAALGRRPSELRGTRERDLIHPSDIDARDDLVAGTRSGGPALPPIELRMRDQAGAWHWYESIEINRLDDPDVHGIISNARDVTARKAETEDLLERSLRDPVTGIPNRLALMERLEVALSRAARSRDTLAVLFCDLDDFKHVNDVFGHAFADGVLIEVARRLERLQRKSDTVARIGGDEFVVVCDGLHDADESTAIASRMRDAIEEPIELDGRQCLVTASIGIATIDGRAGADTDPTMLLRNADAAMYRAKRQGRAHWHRFDDALVEEATRRFELESELVPALEHGEFALHYQPIHELIHGFGTKVATDAIAVSLKTNAIAFALMLCAGTPFAYVLARSRFRGRSVLVTLVEVPLVMPPAVAGIALLVAFARLGLLGHALGALGITLAFTPAAVVIAILFVASPLYLRGAIASFESVDATLLDVAGTLGAGPVRRMVRVAIPLARGGLGAAAAVAFARGLGEFGATILFAGSFQGTTQTLSLAVYSLFDANLDQAVAIGVLLIILSAAILITAKLLVRSWTSSPSTSPSLADRSIFVSS